MATETAEAAAAVLVEWNADAIASLVGYLSTGLGLFLTIPSLVFGYRDAEAYISLHINWIWSVAEGVSLIGLFVVGHALPQQIVLTIWYLISDLAFTLEALVIEGKTKIPRLVPGGETANERFAKKFLKEQFVREERLAYLIRRANALQDPHRGKYIASAFEHSLDRNFTPAEIRYTGAKYKRDLVIQISSLTFGAGMMTLVWYFAIFKTGKASVKYEFKTTPMETWSPKKWAGWALGILSTIIYLAGRIQEFYWTRNLYRRYVNWSRNYYPARGGQAEHGERRDTHKKYSFDSMNVAAVMSVVYSVFIIDNLLQIASIFIVLAGVSTPAEWSYYYSLPSAYIIFESPWIAGSIIPIALDGLVIFNYFRSIGQYRQERDRMPPAEREQNASKWPWPFGYRWNEFPTEPKDHHIDDAFNIVWHDDNARAALRVRWIEYKRQHRSDRHIKKARKEQESFALGYLRSGGTDEDPTHLHKTEEEHTAHINALNAHQNAAHDANVARRRAKRADRTRAAVANATAAGHSPGFQGGAYDGAAHDFPTHAQPLTRPAPRPRASSDRGANESEHEDAHSQTAPRQSFSGRRRSDGPPSPVIANTSLHAPTLTLPPVELGLPPANRSSKESFWDMRNTISGASGDAPGGAPRRASDASHSSQAASHNQDAGPSTPGRAFSLEKRPVHPRYFASDSSGSSDLSDSDAESSAYERHPYGQPSLARRNQRNVQSESDEALLLGRR